MRVGTATDSLDWDDFGQLRKVIRAGTAIVTFDYDGFGRRIRKRTASDTVQYVWDGDQLVLEANGSGTTLRAYTYYPGVDRLHSVSTPTATYYASIEPATGDVNGLIKSSNDSLAARYAYTPWGELEVDQQVAGVNSLRWKGLLYDSETGLYYVRARYYDPKVRRFISEDPIGLDGGLNVYTFGGGDPVNASDPSGLDPCTLEQLQQGWQNIQVGIEGGPDSKSECMSSGGLPPIVIRGQAPGFWESVLNFLWNSDEVFAGQNFEDIPGNHVVALGLGPLSPGPGAGPGLQGASKGLKALFAEGSLNGANIIDVRAVLLEDGFTMSKARKFGYLFEKEGEQVRIMWRNGNWEARVMNRFGKYLDEFGFDNPDKAATHLRFFSK